MNWTQVAHTAWNNSINDLHMMRRHEWLTAMICAKNTAAWREIGMSENIADKLRAGWAIFEALRQYNPAKARELRNRYSYRRFVDMGAGWVKYEFDAAQAVDHMESDLSNAAMVMQIVDVHDPRPEWERKGYGMYKTIGKFVEVAYDAPEWFLTWARDSKKLFERNGIK